MGRGGIGKDAVDGVVAKELNERYEYLHSLYLRGALMMLMNAQTFVDDGKLESFDASDILMDAQVKLEAEIYGK